MPKNPQDSLQEPPLGGGNFLATIQQDPGLLEKMQAVDGSRQTITIDSSGKLSVVTDSARTDSAHTDPAREPTTAPGSNAPRGDTPEPIATVAMVNAGRNPPTPA